MAKKLLTESDVRNAVKRGEKTISVEPHTIITPSAKDVLNQYGITVTVPGTAHQSTTPPKAEKSYDKSPVPYTTVGNTTIVIGSDHGGYAAKEIIKKFLTEKGYSILDIGTMSEEPCDYPDYAYAVGRIVARGEAWRGIMIDATGVASAVVCNKIPGVRAAACYNEFVARSSREHNDANVLTLGAKAIGIETLKSIVVVWLETWFGGGRHRKRVDKISDIEKKFSR